MQPGARLARWWRSTAAAMSFSRCLPLLVGGGYGPAKSARARSPRSGNHRGFAVALVQGDKVVAFAKANAIPKVITRRADGDPRHHGESSAIGVRASVASEDPARAVPAAAPPSPVRGRRVLRGRSRRRYREADGADLYEMALSLHVVRMSSHRTLSVSLISRRSSAAQLRQSSRHRLLAASARGASGARHPGRCAWRRSCWSSGCWSRLAARPDNRDDELIPLVLAGGVILDAHVLKASCLPALVMGARQTARAVCREP